MTDLARPVLARYEEDDWIARVEVVEDRSTRRREAYRLRVVATIQPSYIYNAPVDGELFDCDQIRTGPYRIFTLTLEEP